MSFPNSQPAEPIPAKRRSLIIPVVLCVVVLVVGTVLVVWLVTRSTTAPATTPSATPVANGIEQPDPSCVRTTGSDHDDLWNNNGWWAGRVDGQPREMGSLAVLQLKLGGHQIDSVWICAPRAQG